LNLKNAEMLFTRYHVITVKVLILKKVGAVLRPERNNINEISSKKPFKIG